MRKKKKQKKPKTVYYWINTHGNTFPCLSSGSASDRHLCSLLPHLCCPCFHCWFPLSLHPCPCSEVMDSAAVWVQGMVVSACCPLQFTPCPPLLLGPHCSSPWVTHGLWRSICSWSSPAYASSLQPCQEREMDVFYHTYVVNEGQVSKVHFDAGAMDAAPGRHGAGASGAGPAWCMSRTTILATPAPALPAAPQAEGPQGHLAGEADGGAQSISFYMQKPTELHSSSSSILKSTGCLPPQSSCQPVMPPWACVEVLMNRLVVFHRNEEMLYHYQRHQLIYF